MALLDDLNGKLSARPKLCAMGSIVGSLDAWEQDALQLCMDKIHNDKALPQHKRVFTVTWLVTVLNNNGHSIGKTAVSEHLNGTCICVK